MHKEGPLLVLAAPGSGKTSVICNRVHFLIEELGILPERICVLTFTREAAGTMQQRINQNHPYPVSLGTVHSLCYQILSQHSILRSRKLLTASQKGELIRRILAEQHAGEKFYTVSMQEVESVSNELTRTASFLETAGDPIPGSLYALYRQKKEELGVLDFDDLLLITLQILRTEKETRSYWQKRYDFYLVDEFQDLNEIQFQILSILSELHGNIMAVGDDDQSIYGFRGSSPDILKRFQRVYPMCSKIFLDQNYRSTDSIISLSGICIKNNRKRFPKQIYGTGKEEGQILCNSFSSEAEQASFIMDTVRKLNQKIMKSGGTQTAILFRTRQQMEKFCSIMDITQGENDWDCLRMQQCLFQDLKHILAIMLKQGDVHDVLAIMNHPQRGLSRMFMPLENFSLQSWEEFCIKCKENGQAEKVHLLRVQLETAFSFHPDLGLRYLMETCGYRKYIINKFNKNDNTKSRFENAYEQSIKKILSLNWRETLDKLNSELIIINEKLRTKTEYRNSTGEKGVCFLTMHASKGLEFEHVILPNMNDGIFPSGKTIKEGELEQERRLFYVAMTRAKKTLIMTYLKDSGHKKSRFLSELGF